MALNTVLNCEQLARAGCNCYGCCFVSLPPPPSPVSPPPSPPSSPPKPPTNPPWPATAVHLNVSGTNTLCGIITSDTWLTAVDYELTCSVIVAAGATLTIEAGCSVRASGGWQMADFSTVDSDGDGRIAPEELQAHFGSRVVVHWVVGQLLSALDDDDSDDLDSNEWSGFEDAAASIEPNAVLLGSAIIIERGARLVASGRADAPITFDFAGTGDGLVIFGGAPISHEAVPSPSYPYGGDDWSDDSGVLRHVRVWYSRRGVALFGVGNGTVVEHCEVAHIASDGFIFHGGAVDVRRLSALFANSSAIVLSGGYAGRGQFIFVALGAHGRAGITITGPTTRPRLFSITVLGGGAEGMPSSSLVHLGGGGGEVVGALFLYSRGVGVELGSPAADFAQLYPSPPPSPSPPSPFAASLLYTHRECGLQHPDGLSEGVGLGSHPSAESCALAAGSYYLISGECQTFQYSAIHPLWGCICCTQADGGRPSSLWAVYQLSFTPPPLPAIPHRVPLLPPLPPPPPLPGPRAEREMFFSRGNIVSEVQVAVASSSGTALTELATSAAEPGLFSINGSCLSSRCLLESHFDPLPSANGGACVSVSEGAPARDGGFFETVKCAGAFPSPNYADNWLAGWSLLFPVPLGTDIASAAELGVGSGMPTVSTNLETAFLRRSSRGPTPWSRCQGFVASFDGSQCPRSAFGGRGPVFWARITPPAGELHLSTCTHGGGFDTDLTVFELADSGGCEPKQIACNGDGVGDDDCQPLYSRLSVRSHGNTTYVVAVGAYSGEVGDNVTLTARVTQPQPLPSPPPTAPPPPPLYDEDLQALIDRAPSGRPYVIRLGSAVQLRGLVVIPTGKQVVLRGEAPRNRTTIVAERGSRHFEVQDGAELYLSNLVIDSGQAGGACGGAVVVRGRGKLIAQYCIFSRNLAARGGAICVESDGALMILVGEMMGNFATSADGHDIHLGRPVMSEPRVELLGLQLSRDSARAVTQVGAWTTSSCLSDSRCAFYRVGVGFDTLAPRAYCFAMHMAGLVNLSLGSSCACTVNASVPFAQTDEERALAPYGISPIDTLVVPMFTLPTCRLPRKLVHTPSFSDTETTVELKKTHGMRDAQERTASIALDFLEGASGAIQRSGATWWVVALNPGTHPLRVCLGDQEGEAAIDHDFLCTIFPNGSMSVLFNGVEGWPMRVRQTTGVAEPSRGYTRNVDIPIIFDTKNVRETERFPYQQKLRVMAEVQQADGAYRFSRDIMVSLFYRVVSAHSLSGIHGPADRDARALPQVRVAVSADVVPAECTYVPPPPPSPPAPPSVPAENVTIPCMCENTCLKAPRDGVCDDGGPGHNYIECELGTDCADCGPRAGPAVAFQRESYNSSGMETVTFSQMLQRMDTELVEKQITSCIPEHFQQSVCTESMITPGQSAELGCRKLGLDGESHPLCHAKEAEWVEGLPEKAQRACEVLFDDSLTAVPMSSSGGPTLPHELYKRTFVRL